MKIHSCSSVICKNLMSLVALGGLLLSAGTVKAANQYYDINKTSGNWYDSTWGANNTTGPWTSAWVPGNDAFFYPVSASLTLTIDSNVSADGFLIQGPVSPANTLTLNGPGTLTTVGTISGNRGFYIGRTTTFDNNTTIEIAKDAYLALITDGSDIGTIKLTANATVEMNNGFNKTINGTSLDNQGHVLTLQVSDKWLYNFPIQGAGQVVFDANGNNLHAAAWSGNNTFTGGLRIKQGELYLQSAGALNSTTPNVVSFDAGSTNKLSLNGWSVSVAGLSGGGTSSQVRNDVLAPYGIRGTINNQAATLTITNSADYTYDGVLVNGDTAQAVLSVVKDGAGVQSFAGTNTYTGTTAVNQGGLIVDGMHTGGAAYTVSNGAWLGGDGTINANVTFDAGALLVFNPLETLDISGEVSFDDTFSISSLRNADGTAINWGLVDAGTYTLLGTTASDFSNIANFGSANAADIGGGKSAYFENGSLQLHVVPEPSTLALFGLAGAAVAMGLRRRRK